MNIRSLFWLLIFFTSQIAFAQPVTKVKGKITNKETGDPIPFVGVLFKGTTIGTNTDFEGNFSISTNKATDSLIVQYVGLKRKARKVKIGEEQIMNIQMEESSISLGEVVIRPGENPAWPIMRQVIKNKDKNDSRALKAYEYESYNKIELDVDNISNKMSKVKFVKKIRAVMDSIQKMVGEDGKPIVPVFISESISKYYYNATPERKKEEVIKTKVSGIGTGDNSIVNQVIGSTFQQYNFYKNWLNIVQKEFVSPINDNWKFFYEYTLLDSSVSLFETTYRIEVTPKREQDLAFTGIIWINKSDYALTRIDATISKSANLNFVDKVKIQQELEKTEAGAYLPVKNRITVDIAQISKNWAGMLAKFYTSHKDIKINQPKPASFFDQHVSIDENVNVSDDEYWQLRRHDSLTLTEKNVYRMIDTVKNLPVVKTYVEIANIFINGYKRIGKIDYGPYLYTYSFNNVEGHRFRLGFKTNIDFSKKWVIRAYAAYGTQDQRWKYNVGVEHIINRKRWTVLAFETKDELEQLALMDNSISSNSLFTAFTRIGNIKRTRPFYQSSTSLSLFSEVKKGLTLGVGYQLRNFDPVFDFKYQNQTNPSDIKTTFISNELFAEIKYGPDEIQIMNENSRISLGAQKWPILTFRYTRGFRGVMASDFNYNKYYFQGVQYVQYGWLGQGRYAISGGYIPSTLPYPLLRAHLGNRTYFMNMSAFNMMNFFEFVSDRFVGLNYQHNFEGWLLNSIPYVAKLKWRLVATGNILMGHMGNRNEKLIIQETDNDQPFSILDKTKPYAEVGYGVENIFKVLRVDFIHRLTYLGNDRVRPFGIKVSAQFKL